MWVVHRPAPSGEKELKQKANKAPTAGEAGYNYVVTVSRDFITLLHFFALHFAWMKKKRFEQNIFTL